MAPQLAAYTSLPLYTQRIDLRYAWNDSPSSGIHKVPNYCTMNSTITLPALWKREGVFAIPLLVIRD